MIFPCFFCKSVTDQPTDRPTEGRTEKPGYRDARTHLKSIPNVVHFSKDTSVSKYHLKPSQTVQKMSKQGLLMRKTKRISFLMVPNLYFSPFWLKNEILFHYDKSCKQKNAPFNPTNTL